MPSTIRPRWKRSGRRFSDDVDLVNGYKISRSDPLHRIVIGRIYHHTVKLLFGLRVRDVDCDFRLMRRSIFERVALEKNSGVICLEMMKKIQDAGFRIAEVPVHHYHRAYGQSQFFNFRRLFKTAVDVVQLWFALVVRHEHRRVRPRLPTRPQRARGPETADHELSRLLSRPAGHDHRWTRLHRQQPRPPTGGPRRRRPASSTRSSPATAATCSTSTASRTDSGSTSPTSADERRWNSWCATVR